MITGLVMLEQAQMDLIMISFHTGLYLPHHLVVRATQILATGQGLTVRIVRQFFKREQKQGVLQEALITEHGGNIIQSLYGLE